MIKVKLLPHNQITFEKILELSKTCNKICIPQATGTGKTYLEAKIVEEWSDKNVMIFAPRNEILDETKNTFKDDCGIDEINTITYQTFNNMTEEEIINMDLDVILFDEAHRLLAPEWNKKIQVLIDSHPKSLIFGMTATPIRLDGRDIRNEIFDNCSTHYITLGEAIVRDIVKMPIYVSALYTLSDTIKEMNDKIDKSKNTKEEKKLFKKAVEKARRHLELSSGVPVIINKYFEDYNGKYLVFCRNTEHLEESISMVENWFREAGYNGSIYNYRIGSSYSDSNEQLDDFKKDNRNGLKLLFSIEKLNEGVHIPTVDGVILLRPTISNIVYYQQIGRCIRADDNKRPLILDLVNNIHGIKIPLKDDIDRCIQIRKSGEYAECDSDFNVENYSIIDYLQETASVFSEIENQLIGLKNDWTNEELVLLDELFPKIGGKAIVKMGVMPNHNYGSIKQKAYERGLVFRENKKYVPNDRDDKILIDNYKNLGRKVIELLPHMTENQIKYRAKQLGLVFNNNNWEKQEDKILEDYYNVLTLDELIKKLPKRSKTAITSRASKLGFTSDRSVIWTEDEDKKLGLYPELGSKIFKELPNKSKYQIQDRLKLLGVKKSRPFKSKYKYVTKLHNKWVVQFTIDGKTIKIGAYDSEDEAGRVAMEKAKEYGKAI